MHSAWRCDQSIVHQQTIAAGKLNASGRCLKKWLIILQKTAYQILTKIPVVNTSGNVELFAAIVDSASPQLKMEPSTIILPILGSIGNFAKMRPSDVSSSLESKHFISRSFKNKST
jgi:hypothetical protein